MLTHEVARLARLAQEAAEGHPDQVAVFRAAVKAAIASEADPYLVIGLMVEGIAATISDQRPPEQRREIAAATIHLLLDRFAARGLIDS
jgi:hypothetical protein